MEQIAEKNSLLILYDGYCNLCSRAIQFIIRNDRKGIFRFLALSSEEAKEKHPLFSGEEEPQSVVLIMGSKVYTHSTAALKIARHLQFPVNLMYALVIVPSWLRDPVYRWIAKKRYRWFGKRKQCFIPEQKDF